MKEISVGEFIQKIRKERGISQEDLCEGVCDQGTLSRLENGARNPSYAIVKALLQKLDLDGERFFALLTPQEEQVERLRKGLVSCNVRFERAGKEERAPIRAEAYETFHALEGAADPSDRITAQLLLRSRVILGREDGTPYTPEESLALLTDAIRMTSPKFTTDCIAKGLYSLDEVKVIIQIANIYWKTDKREKALDIYRQLLDYAQSQFNHSRESAGVLTLITHNYAGDLEQNGQYAKAIEIAELGRKACVNYGHYQYLGGLLHTLGICYHFCENDRKSIECFYEAYFQYKAAEDEKGTALLQADANEYFGLLKNIVPVFNAIWG